jgi:oligoendopeptidase F
VKHKVIKKAVSGETSVIESFDKSRMNKMGLENYKPWDTSVDASGKDPLKPFEGGQDLINKSIRCFERLRPYYGESKLSIMGTISLAIES